MTSQFQYVYQVWLLTNSINCFRICLNCGVNFIFVEGCVAINTRYEQMFFSSSFFFNFLYCEVD